MARNQSLVGNVRTYVGGKASKTVGYGSIRKEWVRGSFQIAYRRNRHNVIDDHGLRSDVKPLDA